MNQNTWGFRVEGLRICDLLRISEINSHKTAGNLLKPSSVSSEILPLEIDVYMRLYMFYVLLYVVTDIYRADELMYGWTDEQTSEATLDCSK